MKIQRKVSYYFKNYNDIKTRIQLPHLLNITMILFDISASITLHGHNGPIYGLSFSPDRSLLLSCSEDGTIRLWSLQTWTCLVNYKVLCSLEMNNSTLLTVFIL